MRKPRDLYPVTKKKKTYSQIKIRQINDSNITSSYLSLVFEYFGSVLIQPTMNNVDYLFRVQFSTLPLEEKLEIKRLGPHRPDDLILLQPGQKATRTFKTEWYDRKTWLTSS